MLLRFFNCTVMLKALVNSRLLEFGVCPTSDTLSSLAGVSLVPIPFSRLVREISYFTEGGEECVCTPEQVDQLLLLRGGFIRLINFTGQAIKLYPQIDAAEKRLSQARQKYHDECTDLWQRSQELLIEILEKESNIRDRLLDIDQDILSLEQDVLGVELERDGVEREKGTIDLDLELGLAANQRARQWPSSSEAELDLEVELLKEKAEQERREVDSRVAECNERISKVSQEIKARRDSKDVDLETASGDAELLALNRSLLKLKAQKQDSTSKSAALKDKGEPKDAELDLLRSSLESCTGNINATLNQLFTTRRDLSLDGVEEPKEVILDGPQIVSDGNIRLINGLLSCPAKVSVGGEVYHWVLNSKFRTSDDFSIQSGT